MPEALADAPPLLHAWRAGMHSLLHPPDVIIMCLFDGVSVSVRTLHLSCKATSGHGASVLSYESRCRLAAVLAFDACWLKLTCPCCSLGDCPYVKDKGTAEEPADQKRTCREVTDSMISAVEQGQADRAVTMFNPNFLAKVSTL